MTARQQGQGVASAGIARCSRCGHGTPTKGRKRVPWGWVNACCQRQRVPAAKAREGQS